MPRKTNRDNVKRSKPNRRRRKKNPKRKRKSAKQHSPALQMLLNPCTAPLAPGFHATSEGILSRFKTVYSPGAATTSGYVLWCPHYVSKTATRFETAFIFGHNTSSTEPPNTTAEPYGTGGNTALAINVGSSDFVSSAVCSDFRLLSACIKLNYTGSISTCAGLVTRVSGLSVDTLLHGSATDAPISVDDIFALTDGAERLSLDTMELRHRPDTDLADSFKSDDDALIYKGVAASEPSILTNESKRFHPTVFGFAWKGVPTASLSATFIQNIEWRPDGQSGISIPRPVQLHDEGYVSKLLKYADDYFPGWQNAATGAAKSFAAKAISNAFAPTNLLM